MDEGIFWAECVQDRIRPWSLQAFGRRSDFMCLGAARPSQLGTDAKGLPASLSLARTVSPPGGGRMNPGFSTGVGEFRIGSDARKCCGDRRWRELGRRSHFIQGSSQLIRLKFGIRGGSSTGGDYFR